MRRSTPSRRGPCAERADPAARRAGRPFGTRFSLRRCASAACRRLSRWAAVAFWDPADPDLADPDLADPDLADPDLAGSGLACSGLAGRPVEPAGRDHVGVAARQLVGDCEAFLAGRLAEVSASRCELPPVWAWTNLLAHGSERGLRDATRQVPTALGRLAPWQAARAALAEEVLFWAGRRGSLAEIQREVLVPLELTLASSSVAALWSAGDWLEAVHDALRRGCSSSADS